MLRKETFAVLDARRVDRTPENPNPYFGDVTMPHGELRVPETKRRFAALREDKLQRILREANAAEDIREHLRWKRKIVGLFWSLVITALGSLAVLKILGLL